MSEKLEDIYRDYIAALNGRRFDDSPTTATSGRATSTGRHWLTMCGKSLICTTKFSCSSFAQTHVACRLWFDCTPKQVFLGGQETLGCSRAGHRGSCRTSRGLGRVLAVVEGDAEATADGQLATGHGPVRRPGTPTV